MVVMADCFTEERFQVLRALGAEIDVVHPSKAGRRSRRKTSATW